MGTQRLYRRSMSIGQYQRSSHRQLIKIVCFRGLVEELEEGTGRNDDDYQSAGNPEGTVEIGFISNDFSKGRFEKDGGPDSLEDHVLLNIKIVSGCEGGYLAWKQQKKSKDFPFLTFSSSSSWLLLLSKDVKRFMVPETNEIYNKSKLAQKLRAYEISGDSFWQRYLLGQSERNNEKKECFWDSKKGRKPSRIYDPHEF